MKVSQDSVACTHFNINLVKVIRREGRLLVDTPGVLATGSKTGGGNSGFQALNLAVQFGAKRIILVGFDMRIDKGEHWHGRHPKGLNNPGNSVLMHWREALNATTDRLAAYGIEVINASPISTLSAFPVMKLADALGKA